MTREEAVLALDRASRDEEALLGPKARNLARLREGGVAVPDGFVVTAAAWRGFMERSGLRERVARELARITRGSSLDALRDAAKAIERAHDEAPLPEDLELAVREACSKLGGETVAVRSSATEEDQAAHSAAGVFHTALDVRGQDAVLAALRRCWASLYTEAALAYRLDRGLPPSSGAMAVVVQRMVRPDAAGVLFTRSPLGEDRDVILIEAVPGRGRELVEGEANPERYEIGKDATARLVSAARAAKRLLSADELSALSRAAHRVEELLGPAVDVEWAICEGRLEILQARPITARATLARAPQGAVKWTAANTQEALLEPVCPLTWSLLEPLVERGRADLFRAAGFAEVAGPGYMRLFFGRPYFNPDYFRKWLRQVPGAPENIFDALIFGEGKVEVHFRTLEFDRRTFRAIALLLASRLAARERFELFLYGFEGKVAALAARDLPGASDDALLDLRARATDLAESALRRHVLGTAIAGASYLLLDLLLKKTGVEPALGEGLVARLAAGTQGNILVQANVRLHELARLARSDDALKRAVFEGSAREVEPRVERLRAATGDPKKTARAFLDAWRRFLSEHGHRAEQEAELAAPRWVEDPAPVVSVLASYVASDDVEPPRDREKRLAASARELAQRVARALHRSTALERVIPARTGLFWLLYRETRRYAPYRENLKAAALRALFLVKRVFLEAGRRLVERRLLAAREDVFFLELRELEAALRGEVAAGSLQDAVSRRRADHARDLAMEPPPFVVEDASGKIHPLRHDRSEGALSGVPVSQGVVEGTARVLRSLEDAPRVRKGDVIVARVVNAAWTPLFVLAGGIVAEMGGALSHGAIVAREYGLPCVFGVTGATTRIKDGDRVLLDGDRGVVRVVEGR